MSKYRARFIAVLAAVSSVIFTGCPIEGRRTDSNCAFIPGAEWTLSGIEHHLSEPSICPIQVSAGGRIVNYAASATMPYGNLDNSEYYLHTRVYDATLTYQVGYDDAPWYWLDYSTIEADIAFNYLAGATATVASNFTDQALNYTQTTIGQARGVAYLTYRTGLVASISGSVAPTPGTNASWTLAGANATAPFTYRWFKDGSELNGQTSSSLSLPVTNTYFTLRGIVASSNDGADTLEISVTPSWHVTIYGMTDRGPNLTCGFDSDVGNNPSPTFTYRWSLDGTDLPDSGPSTNPTFSMGSHTLELFVTDQNGYQANAAVNVTVRSDGPNNCM